MKVSIVIPCFNHARFIHEAVASARAQDWPDTEVIVVDDGSTDDSGPRARAAGATRVIRQRNRGLANARNAGIDAATGDILIFLDADDRLHPQAARIAVDRFRRNPRAAMTYGRCQLIDALGAPLPTRAPRLTGDPYEGLLRQNYIWTPAIAAFRREIFSRTGRFDARVNPSADYDLYLRIARRHVIVAHDAVVADYRQHGSNMSSDPVRMLTSTLVVLDRQRRVVARDPRLRRAYREGVRAWHTFYGERLVARFRRALHAGEVMAAITDAWHLLRFYPEGVVRELTKKIRLAARSAPPKWLRPGAAPRSLPAADA